MPIAISPSLENGTVVLSDHFFSAAIQRRIIIPPASLAQLKPSEAKEEAKNLPSLTETQEEDEAAIILRLDKPCCIRCGESEEIKVHKALERKSGGYSQRWQCKKCKKTWVRKAAIALLAYHDRHGVLDWR